VKFSLISDWFTDFLHHQFKQFSTRSGYALGVSALALFCMSLLSWQLLEAIALGIAVAWGVHESQQPNALWVQRGRKSLEKLWGTALGKAAMSGSSAALLLLSGLGLTSATGRGWIAATLILQSIMAVGVWAIWRKSQFVRPSHRPQNSSPNLDRYIYDLAHPALMRRMIAIRRLHHVLQTQSLSPTEQHELGDYFQILLTQESDAGIRLALQDVLETFYRKSHSPRAISGSSLEDLTAVQVRNVSNHSRTPSLSAAKL
jgi:hypothetical protein